VPAPKELARAADRLAGLVGKWSDAVYKKHIEPKAHRPRAETAAFFEKVRAGHGACKVKSFSRWVNQPSFVLGCERGGDVKLTVALDDKNEDAITGFSITGEDDGGCAPK
jgi:hypothetical protein